MSQPLVRHMKGMRSDTHIDGYMNNDPISSSSSALTPCQVECINRLCMSIQLEQEVYLINHPEVSAMLKIIIGDLYQKERDYKRVEGLACHLVRPASDLDEEIRKVLKLPPYGPYREPKAADLDEDLHADLIKIISKHNSSSESDIKSEASTPNTLSSSFLTFITSPTTQRTPEESEPVLEQTMSQIIRIAISNTIEKAMVLKLTENEKKYDTAYVELMRAVEAAMEITVKEIREDIADLFQSAYKAFEYNIIAKEKIKEEIAWDRRMRKKLKKLLRRQKNFKGYETPPSSSSELSSHPSYKIPPQRPCVCHPKWTFNRYPKDRYGIYIASAKEFDDCSTTVSPTVPDIYAKTECENNNHKED